ncbi:porin [Oceanobacter mangrovi]|uniref:porin n=1 Tax=Oceanobacter mangrovi TaxID=2862510 RepID=UPI001C8EAF29|nr:porin [Oceanobacter mangrovi]
MNTSIKKLSFCVAAMGMAYNAQALNADDVTLTIYGKMHASVSYMDSDISSAQADNDSALSDGDISVSSNSSRLGFKGEAKTGRDDLVAIYQIEQAINLDGNQDGDTFTNRNSFLGLKGLQDGKTLWTVKLGYYDTLGKSAAGLTMLGDTVGDKRAIIGSGALSGNKADKRVANMLLGEYFIATDAGKLTLAGQYSAQAGNSKGTVDDNAEEFSAVGVNFAGKGYEVRAAHDFWKNGSAANLHVTRVSGLVKQGDWSGVVLAENMRGSGDLNRKAWGAQLGYQLNDVKLIGSVFQAGDYKNSSNTGAVQTAVGAEYKLTGSLMAYAVYTQTDNDANAKYQGVDAGMGDELKTVTGGSPRALSSGMVLKF